MGKPNSFEPDGRGASDGQLLLCGVAVLVVAILITSALLFKSTGRLNEYVKVVADLFNVGDGLPEKSDVKYHGVLVGTVNSVVPAAYGQPNYVRIDLKPEYAPSIPATVTARVVPSNIFAVSSIELIGNDFGVDGAAVEGTAIRPGDHIAEDTRLPTVLFQTTITKLRELLNAGGRGPEDTSVGIFAALAAATSHRREALVGAGKSLDRLVDQLNSTVGTDTGPSTLTALVDATRGLADTAPDLFDTLQKAVEPMRTFAETRGQLTTLLTGVDHTLGTAHQALATHVDQLIRTTSDFTPVLGVWAQKADVFLPAAVKVDNMATKFMDEVWMADIGMFNARVNIAFTPSYSYTRADCPHYGDLKGPSCYTAPLVAVRPDLPEVLLPQNYQPPESLAPPPGTVVGPDGDLIAVGPPLINPAPNLADPNPPLPAGVTPAPPVPGTAAPASFGGTVGPVGSQYERNMLTVITGSPATVATELLLGPVARGTTVSRVDSAPAGSPR